MWTRESLHDLVAVELQDVQLIVVANREPNIHRSVGKRIECFLPASGIATELSPIMLACGVWVARGSGGANRKNLDAQDHA